MAEFSVVGKIAEIEALLEDAKKNGDRFDRGIRAAGTKVRKAMSDLKKVAQEIREGVAEAKADMLPDPAKSAKAKERSVFCKK